MSRRRTKPRARHRQRPEPKRQEIPITELHGILERARRAPLALEEIEKLRAALETLSFITAELERADTTLARLRKLLFGSSSEKTKDVVGERGSERDAAVTQAKLDADAANAERREEGWPSRQHETSSQAHTPSADHTPKGETQRKGHGRNSADAYIGADKVRIANDALSPGDLCPRCDKGKVYRLQPPKVLVRIRGVAPLSATVYELERLRCALCGALFTAPAPPGVGEAKYDETAAAMIALLKYGCGLPFNRIERLMRNLEIPMPSATQWDVVAGAAPAFEPVWAALIEAAAAGEVVHIDDTHARILALNEAIRKELELGLTERTGIFTSGVVSSIGERKVALFFTGRAHAGENLDKVLAQRASALPAPIQMGDALSRNTTPGEFETLVAKCLAHARRNFVDLVENFPDEVAHVLVTLRNVYRYDAHARAEGMSPEQRLAYHQEHSQALMEELEIWLQAQFDERRVEPNSSLGGAIRYLQNHWGELTLFLRVPGAPLDNNVAERSLKRAILHRKNSLFYKTENGAHVGDLFMSLIHTAELCTANPFDYLVAVQRHRKAVADNPEQWLPWSYTEARARGQPPPLDPSY